MVFPTICALGGSVTITRTVVLVVVLTTTHASCGYIAEKGIVPVPLAIIALLRTGAGLKKD